MTDTAPEAPPPPQAAGAAPVTINLGDLFDAYDGMAVTIRPHLNYAASQRIETARMRMSAQIQGNRAQRRAAEDEGLEMRAEVLPLQYAAAVVEECVISWTLRGYDNKPLPATAEGINSQQAPASLLDDVIGEIVDYYEERRPKRRKRNS